LADVFIAYSRLDHDRVRPIAERLGSLGHSIWWMQRARSGQASIAEIERELDAARVVLTAWSRHARDSTLVYGYASRGLDQAKLVQLRLDAVAPPPPFNAHPAADVREGRIEWGPLEDQLARLLRGETPQPAGPSPTPGPFATAAAVGAPALLTTAAALTLAAYASALSASFNGVMSPTQLEVALAVMAGVGGVCTLVAAQRLLAVSRAGG